MLHWLRVAHDVYGNPSLDELIPAVIGVIVLVVVLCLVIVDIWKGIHRSQAVPNSEPTIENIENQVGRKDNYLD
jgi:fumarate reductase subunit D